ncbi:MAG TPA: gamma-glutamyl-gamma-aminobutyrate hydrolase family protein [Solirubrobacteraceae bacterium]|nr:gamma-glutamyl-gamma-aminobutyrate hydrolase family protein [Solirubrobacteraceae bacterium]
MQRPVIGICTALERASWSVWDQTAALVPIGYIAAVQRAGGLALLLAPDEHAAREPGEVLELIDGLMLAGGADIDPSSYGEPAHPETHDTVPERDAFEIALTRAAIGADVPVLGICRGMQLINVALGGTLVQHLPELVGHGDHRRVLGSFEGAEHDVMLIEDSLAASAAGELVHVTKSHHHQGVDRLGKGLVVSGISDLDELPEAIELPDRRFVLGVQWHPEADPESPVVSALVQAAIDAGATLARE